MKRALLISTPLLFGILFAGCWVTWDDECSAWPFGDCSYDYEYPDDYPYVPTCADYGTCGVQPPSQPGSACVPGDLRYCDTPTYCSWGAQTCSADGSGWGPCVESTPPTGCSGYAYDQDCCLAAGGCCQDWYDSDYDGDYTDSIGNCEVPPATCEDDSDCPNGYCDSAEGGAGLCVDTGSCVEDSQCEAFGPGLACDDRGICAPETGPCPSGLCGCESDSECDAGLMCLDSRCVSPDSVCLFDFECAEGSLCLDNECHRACADTGSCPSGQVCSAGLCLEPAEGSSECVFDEDCEAGRTCINAACLPTCTSDEGCADGEVCRAGACRADSAPQHECASDTDCSTSMSCQRGACRLPCVADINCTGDMTVCGESGFCIDDAEIAPQCTRSSDCGDGKVCLSNSCTTLAE